MKKLVGTLLIVGLMAGAANADSVRVFFDIEGSSGADNASHRPGDHFLSYGNPELGPGVSRLYIYLEFHRNDQVVLSPNFDITVDDGAITEAWNYNGPGQDTLSGDQRWDAAEPNPAVNPGGNSVSFTSANLTHMGLKNGAFADLFDVQHDNTRNDGETMLGYVDVVNDAGGASVWLTVGGPGFAIMHGGPDDDIFFGYGDDPVPAGKPGIRSQIADAGIPEPAGLMLLGLGVLVLRRRR